MKVDTNGPRGAPRVMGLEDLVLVALVLVALGLVALGLRVEKPAMAGRQRWRALAVARQLASLVSRR